MKSLTTTDFWCSYKDLPPDIRQQARKSYKLWQANHSHPSLRFEKKGNYWAVRITRGYRALGREKEGILYWFWIGNHDNYEKILKSNRP